MNQATHQALLENGGDYELLSQDIQEVIELIGVENTEKLVRRFGGMSIYIPKMERFLRPFRDQEIRKRFQSGASVRDLAREYELSLTHVQRIVNTGRQRQREDVRQQGLFTGE